MEKIRGKILIITTIAIVASLIIGSIVFGGYNKEKQEKGCLQYNGKWLEKFQECTNLSATNCEKIGGKFNGCASPCRHTKQDYCIRSCDPVCEL